MSDGDEHDNDSQEQAVRQLESEGPGCSSSYKSRGTNVHFEVILQEESEELVLIDDWMYIGSSSSEDDEQFHQREIIPASKKGTARISVHNSNQEQISPVLNRAVNKIERIEIKKEVARFNLQKQMKDPLSSSVHVEIPASLSPKNSSEYSTAVTASNCTPMVSCEETDNIMPCVDFKQQETDTSCIFSSLSSKMRADSCSSLDASEGRLGNLDIECISSDETEDVDMIQSMPNTSLSCSDSITLKDFSGSSVRETTVWKSRAAVTPEASGSSAPKNLDTAETFNASAKQTNCVTLPEVEYGRSVVTHLQVLQWSYHEKPLSYERTAARKNSVGSELSDKSREKMSIAVGKDKASCNMISNCVDDSDTEDVIIISDDEGDNFREPQNLDEASDESSVCVKNSSVNASQFFSELSVRKLSLDVEQEQTDFTHISDVSSLVTVDKAVEIGSNVKKIDVFSRAKADSTCLSEDKNAALKCDPPSGLSTVNRHQQLSFLTKVNNHQPSNQNKFDRCQLLPRSHKDDDHQKPPVLGRKHNLKQLSTLNKVDHHQQLSSLNKDDDHRQSSVVQREGDHNHPSSFDKLDDHQQQSNHQQRSNFSQESSDFHYDDQQHSPHSNKVEDPQQSSIQDKIDNHQEQFNLHGVVLRDAVMHQPLRSTGQEMQVPKFAEQTGSTKSAGHKTLSLKKVVLKTPRWKVSRENATSGKLPELTSQVSGQEIQVESLTEQPISTVKCMALQAPFFKNRLKCMPSGEYRGVKVGAKKNDTKTIQIIQAKEQENSPLKLPLHQPPPRGVFEKQSCSTSTTTEQQIPAHIQNAPMKLTSLFKAPETRTSSVKAPSSNILPPEARKTPLSSMRFSTSNISVKAPNSRKLTVGVPTNIRSPVKALVHSSSSMTSTKLPLQQQSSNPSKLIPTTKSQVQEHFKRVGTEHRKTPNGAYKGQQVNFVGGKMVNSDKSEVYSQPQRLEVELPRSTSSELGTPRRVGTTSESNIYSNNGEKSQERVEGHNSASLDYITKLHQTAAVSEDRSSCHGSKMGYLKAKEYYPPCKKVRLGPKSDVTRPFMGPESDVTRPFMGPESDVTRPFMGPERDVTRPFMGPSLPSPDSTVPDRVLCRNRKCSKLPKPLISVQKSSTEVARVGGHSSKFDADKHNGSSFVIEGLKVIRKVNSSLGPLGSVVEHLLVQSTHIAAEGKDPLEIFLVKENNIVLDLISQRLSSQIEENLLPQDLIDSSEEALRMTDQLLEAVKNFKLKGKYLGLDIDAVARATNGNNAQEIIAFVKKMLKSQGKKEAKEEDLRNIFMAVTSKHCILTVETVEKAHQNSSNPLGKCIAKESEASSLGMLLSILPSTSSTSAIQPAECLQAKSRYHPGAPKPRNYSAHTFPTHTQGGGQGRSESSPVFHPSDGDHESISHWVPGTVEQERTTPVYHPNDLRACDKNIQIGSKRNDLLSSERERTFRSEKSFHLMNSVFDKPMLNERKHYTEKTSSGFGAFVRNGKTDHQKVQCRLSSHNQSAVENRGPWINSTESFRIPERANDQNGFDTRLQARDRSCSRSVTNTDGSELGESSLITHRQGKTVTRGPCEGSMNKNETKRKSNPVNSTYSEFNQKNKSHFTPLSHKNIVLGEKSHSSEPEDYEFHQTSEQSAFSLGHNYKVAHLDGHHTQKTLAPEECRYPSQKKFITPQNSHCINEMWSVKESGNSAWPSCSQRTSDSHKMSNPQALELHDVANLMANFHALSTAEQQALMKYLEI